MKALQVTHSRGLTKRLRSCSLEEEPLYRVLEASGVMENPLLSVTDYEL